MTDEQARAERFADVFRAVYLTFHRRDGPRSQLPGASRAVLEHLALAGPLTVGEAAAHISRALIWLTVPGHQALRRDREVLSVEMLASAMARLPPGQADELIAALRTLVDLATPTQKPRKHP